MAAAPAVGPGRPPHGGYVAPARTGGHGHELKLVTVRLGDCQNRAARISPGPDKNICYGCG